MMSSDREDSTSTTATIKANCDKHADDGGRPVFVNKFANDGSFLEMFKKLQKQQDNGPRQYLKQYPKQAFSPVKEEKNDSNDSTDSPDKQEQSTTKFFPGKRRNQKLKVGLIKRKRPDSDDAEQDNNLDAWSKYMNEVKKYKEKYGDDSDKNRPLVK